ncbi:hypothetical protein [Pseudalkalibacillus caeni]|uniref:Uncharacterized protein n=1 Tax=Exobacillus caeni TaxID=2574798 RepID=A0A5R9F913_9BACL|nr:hypothetical protein [Pseudalkalibacillus caeni]TLS36195.1 hypothetical protein FCL54_16295 [Pseudalkalibacillus caeni]
MASKKGKKAESIPFRLTILFVVVFILFLLLIIKLGSIQIFHGDEDTNATQENILYSILQ